ncbi:MAG: tetratricopeptide repeat protein [Myxococcales bacterium]|nr:tetratricopeptide repeat protein [Myxococcales bacterium]
MRAASIWSPRTAPLAACLLLAGGAAHAQGDRRAIEEVDPDAVRARLEGDEPPAVDPESIPFPAPKATPAPPASTPDAGAKAVPEAAKAGPAVEPKADPAPASVQGPPPILLPKRGEGDLAAVWEQWRSATMAKDPKAAEDARAKLKKLRGDLGATNLDEYAVGLSRSATQKLEAKDAVGAIEDAAAAAELAPDLPYAQLALARTYFLADPGQPGRTLSAAWRAVVAVARDPRYHRPAAADLGAAFLAALVATAVAVTAVLFLRRVRYFLHDFHHLFPRSAARWQAGILALVLVGLPLVFRLGVVPALLAAFGAVALHLRFGERIVAAVLIAAAGLVPVAATLLVRHTAFAGTLAEQIYLLERGGSGADYAAQVIAERAAAEQAEFAELFALGRHELRRGEAEASIEHFKAALAVKTLDARAMTNLGNAMMAKGDTEGARAMYEEAARVEPSLAAAHFNLAKVHQRRAKLLPPDQAPMEIDRAHDSLGMVRSLEPSLAARADPPEDDLQLNRYLESPPLPDSALVELATPQEPGDEVSAQIARELLGGSEGPLGPFYPLLLCALAVGLGTLAGPLRASKPCERCGRAVCRRCDRELGVGSSLCGQCVNVFARKNAVSAPEKVRKQIEVARHQRQRDRLAYLFGLVCSGAGHLYSGLPVRGSLYAFAFLFAIALFVLRHGVLRAPYGGLPVWLKLAPIAVAFVAVYLFSLRGLYRRQSG